MLDSAKIKIRNICDKGLNLWKTHKAKILPILVIVLLVLVIVLLIISRARLNKEYEVNNITVTTQPDKYYENLSAEFEKLKDGDRELVKQYFGESDIYTPNEVADKLIWTSMSFVCNTTDGDESTMIVHICSFDYNVLNADYTEAKQSKLKDGSTIDDAKAYAQRIVTRNLVDNKYKVCYNISLDIVNEEVVITEAYKQAITGNWYSCSLVELEKVECISK